ncbi:MAG: SprT family zinc-dependent metalloprotease [Pseudomonadota bacterium]
MPIKLRRHQRARRFVLRVSGGAIHLTIPTRARQATALNWLEQQRAFVEDALKGVPALVPFDVGVELPLLGRTRKIVTGGPRGGALRDDAIALHPSDPKLVAAATERLVRRALLEECEQQIAWCWRALDVASAPVSVRQMRQRWGSCAANGSTTFNWRLAFAPPAVLSYVVAHEAAHRIEMNHGPKFWALVETIYPDFESSSRWLRDHGETLFVYGAG